MIPLNSENLDKTSSDINCNVSLGQSPKAKGVKKPKINKWDLIKPTGFFTAKDTINKTKR